MNCSYKNFSLFRYETNYQKSILNSFLNLQNNNFESIYQNISTLLKQELTFHSSYTDLILFLIKIMEIEFNTKSEIIEIIILKNTKIAQILQHFSSSRFKINISESVQEIHNLITNNTVAICVQNLNLHNRLFLNKEDVRKMFNDNIKIIFDETDMDFFSLDRELLLSNTFTIRRCNQDYLGNVFISIFNDSYQWYRTLIPQEDMFFRAYYFSIMLEYNRDMNKSYDFYNYAKDLILEMQNDFRIIKNIICWNSVFIFEIYDGFSAEKISNILKNHNIITEIANNSVVLYFAQDFEKLNVDFLYEMLHLSFSYYTKFVSSNE